MNPRESTREHWEAHWSGGRIEHEPNNKIVNTIMSLGCSSGWKVLEVGAGRGADSVFLASMGAESYVLDFSAAALETSRGIADASGVSINLVEGNAYDLPFEEGKFDLVFHQGFLEHFHDPEKLLAEQRRVLAPGGYLVVDVPQKYSLYTLKKKVAMKRDRWFAGWETQFSPRQLEGIVSSCGFSVVGSYAWGMTGSYGWGIRDAMHGARNILFKARGRLGVSPDGGEGSSACSAAGSGFQTPRVLCYMADNVGIVARKF